MKNRVAWLLCMGVLCLVLAGIVMSRLEAKTDVIFGGMDGAIVSTDSYVAAGPDETEEVETVDEGWPDIDITEGQYRMVMMFDADYIPYLNAMIHAAEEAGHTVYIAAAYRTYSYQTQMFNAKASQLAGDIDYMDPRYQEFAEKAKQIVMYPGSSEHQLGLAVDIMDRQYKSLIYENMDQELFAWLDEHCAEYGFIKRYPTRKLLLTGWDEPWHYRYVGVEAATYIMEHGICYEEFYKHYRPEFKY